MTTILVTGGAGFIGSAFSRAIGHTPSSRIVAADVLHPQVHPGRQVPDDFPDFVEFVPFDVTEPDAWEPLLRRCVRPDVIVHLAAETGTGQSLSEASRHGLVNVVGTTRMLDAAFRLDNRPAHIVLTSSRAVYGDGAWTSGDGPLVYPGAASTFGTRPRRWDHRRADGRAVRPVPSVAGRTEAHPTNVYAATKLAQEHILDAWCAATETKLSVLRLQNVYGPGQSVTNSYTGVLTYFAGARPLAGHEINVFEDGQIVRDFVYIDDVAAALAAAVRRPPAVTRLLDIGSGQASTILEVAQAMAAAAVHPHPGSVETSETATCVPRRARSRRPAATSTTDRRPWSRTGWRTCWPGSGRSPDEHGTRPLRRRDRGLASDRTSEQLEPTLESLRRAHPDAEIGVANLDLGDVGHLHLAGPCMATSLCDLVEQMLPDWSRHVLLITAPVVVPPDFLDRALAALDDDLRIATVSFLSNANGALSVPHRNEPVHHQVGPHDEMIDHPRLRDLAPTPRLRTDPCGDRSGHVALASCVGRLRRDRGSSAMALRRCWSRNFALDAAARGFLNMVDGGTYVTRAFDLGRFRRRADRPCGRGGA